MSMDVFLKLGDIEGEAQDHAHKGEIDVLAWSWSANQSGTMHIGGGGGSGKVEMQDLNVTKFVDKASTNIWLKCCNGKHYDDAILTVRKAGAPPVEYVKMTMEHVLISSVSMGGSGGEDRVTENISLNFKKIVAIYTPQTSSGAADATVQFEWDVVQNTGG